MLRNGHKNGESKLKDFHAIGGRMSASMPSRIGTVAEVSAMAHADAAADEEEDLEADNRGDAVVVVVADSRAASTMQPSTGCRASSLEAFSSKQALRALIATSRRWSCARARPVHGPSMSHVRARRVAVGVG